MPESIRIPGSPDGAPDWQVAIIDGAPEMVINRASVEALIRESPLGEVEARRRLAVMGYPFGDD